MEPDPIEQYLAQLRVRLLVSRRRAQLILDEAEDHLRESAAAAVAAGRTETEAQQAAIVSFGSIQAVVRAHAAARPWRAAAVLGDIVLVAWKLASVYLLAVFATGLVWHFVAASVYRLMGLTPIAGGGVMTCSRCAVVPGGGPAVPSGLDVAGLAWLGAGLAGVGAFAGFALIRRWQQRGGRVRPLLPGSRAPLAGAAVFVGIAAWLLWSRSRSAPPSFPLRDAGDFFIAALGTAVGYLVALGRALVRRQRGHMASA